MAFYQVLSVLILLIQESQSQLAVCGRAVRNTRIVGGEVAPVGAWPWQADIHSGSSGGSHFCGGSLINREWVMSAAHCFPSGNAGQTVYLGRQSQQGSNPNEVNRTVTQVIRHPNYTPSPTTEDNDIALLKLSSPVSFTDFILPVCLAASGSSFHSGVDSWVTGWGNIGSGVPLPAPGNLMEVEVPVVGNRQCQCDNGVTITENMICAGLRTGGKDSCQGDSGGPMVSKQGDRWIQEGIVSFGEGCARPERPGVYARVSRYQTWINSQISSDQPGFVTFTSTGTDSDLSVTCAGVGPAVTIPTTNIPSTTVPTTTTMPPTSVLTTTTMTSPSSLSTETTPSTTHQTTTTPTATTKFPTTTILPTSVLTTTTTTMTPPPSLSTETTSPTTHQTTTTPTPTTTTTMTPPPPVVCGRAPMNSRISGGASAAAGLWPWMASLQKNGSHVCSGTLVAVDAVLTNANCFSSSPVASDWTVILGRVNLNEPSLFEETVSVSNINVSTQSGSNVAVLDLALKPVLSDYIQPICLDNGRTFSVGATCWAAGWSSGRGGDVQALQEFQTSVVDCGNASTSDSSICTGAITLEQGDSGSPLMCKLDDSWFEAAVLSFENNSTSRKRREAVMVLEKLSRFQDFLSTAVGPFLSPASINTNTDNSTNANATTATITTIDIFIMSMNTTGNGSPATHSPCFFLFHLLVCSLCLLLFS